MKISSPLINRFLSLTSSLLLLLFSLSGIMDFIHGEVYFLSVLSGFASVLYFVAAVLLIFDFLNLEIAIVKKRAWIPFFFIGFAIKISPFVFIMVYTFLKSIYDFCRLGGKFYSGKNPVKSNHAKRSS